MAKKMRVRALRVVDQVAELLEVEANKMPPSFKAQADILRKAAVSQRESTNPRMTRLWEEVSQEQSGGAGRS